MDLVSVIIVNWNGAEVLPDCLESLSRLNHKKFEIVVVDNGSTDDSVEIVNRICGGRAKIIRLEKNIGFSAGVNAGFENAAGEFIALLNNDMAVEPSWLDQPLELLRGDDSIGIVSCRQMNYYDRTKIDELFHCVTNELVFMPFVRGCDYRVDPFYSKPGYVISANGGSAIIRAETVRAVGGFDPDFFGYMEETDFCLRAFLRGWRCVYAPDAVVYHMDGFTFKKNRNYQYYLRERNRIWFLYKNIPVADMFKNIFYIILTELRAFKESCCVHKKPFLYLKARFDALRGLSRYKEVRKENAALFRKRREGFYQFKKYKKLDLASE